MFNCSHANLQPTVNLNNLQVDVSRIEYEDGLEVNAEIQFSFLNLLI